MKVKRVDHIGIAVQRMADVLPVYNLLGLKVTATEELPERGINIAFVPAGECQLELLEPTKPDSTVASFLNSRGQGIHHICLAVEDIDEAVKELLRAGVQMADQAPRPGAGGRRVAFIHPSSTHGVLVELLED